MSGTLRISSSMSSVHGVSRLRQLIATPPVPTRPSANDVMLICPKAVDVAPEDSNNNKNRTRIQDEKAKADAMRKRPLSRGGKAIRPSRFNK